MKKTFIFFAISALFLMLLFPVSVKADPIVRYFGYQNNQWTTSSGSETSCAGTISNTNAIITGSDFYWSGRHDDKVKRADDNWTGVSGASDNNAGIKACTRESKTVSLSVGTYTFKLLSKSTEDATLTLPKITVGGTEYSANDVLNSSSVSQTFSNNQFAYTSGNEFTLCYTVTISGSEYNGTVSVEFKDGWKEKYLFKTLTITPNCTQHTVTVAADDNNKGTVAGGGSYCENSEVTVIATPNPGYNFVNWTDNNNSNTEVSTNASHTFTLTANVSYRANFAACEGAAVTVNRNNNDYGTVTGEGSYCAGSQVNLTATPNSGYRFVNWTVTSGSPSLDNVNNASTHFTMSNPAAAVTVQANFEVNPCTNTKTIQCENTYLTTSTGITVIDGNEAHATPSEIRTASSITTYNGTGYVTLKDASGNGHTGDIFFAFTLYEEANCDITIRYAEANANSYANIFKKVDALTGDISFNGKYYDKISYHRIGGENNWSWPGNFTDWEFTEEDLDATDYILVICNSEGKISLDQITFTASENIFCPNTITMAKSGDASAADPTSTPANTAMAGTEVTITAGEASANHYFSGWTVLPENAVTFADQTNATTTFVMPEADVTITANYGAVVLSEFTYTISGSGTIDCATANGSDVVSGTTISMTAVPSDDYVFTGWTATEGTFSNAAALTTTFTMPASAATVTANFAQVDNKIITGTSAKVIESNGTATLTVTSVSDFDAFNHNVLKFAYSDMEGKYKGQKVAIDEGYSPASSARATGFGFYYKTEKADDHVAFCFEVSNGQQVKWELQATNNVWKYYYFAHPEAAGWAHSGIFIYMNGDDDGAGTHTTYKDAGAFYMSEIAATTITSKPDIANYHYTNDRGGAMEVDDYGTLCLPMDGTIEGATLYSVAGKETGDINYLVLEDKGTSVEAGKPYITQSTATSYTVTMSGAHSEVQAGNGLEGTYETITLTPYNESGPHNYFLYENAFKKAGTGVTVGAYRAYLNWDAVSAAPAQAPSARRIRMVIEGTEVQTGMETVTAMPKTTKVLIDGQLFIIREGKRYTLTGARAQ